LKKRAKREQRTLSRNEICIGKGNSFICGGILFLYLWLVCKELFTEKKLIRHWYGTQLATGATADDGCSFDVDAISGMVVGCNFSESHPLDRVQPWRMGVASQAFWLGGPLFDATNSSQGGY